MRRSLLLTCALAAALCGNVLAHDDDIPRNPTLRSGDADSGGSTSLRDLFSAPKYNETLRDVKIEQQELAIHQTTARLTGDTATEAALDQREAALELRAQIATWRFERDRARSTGDKKKAAKLEGRIHSAKIKLVNIIANTKPEADGIPSFD